MKKVVSIIGLIFLFTLCVHIGRALADVAANAQIINQAQLTFDDGSGPQTINASVTVTVAHVPGIPTIDSPAEQVTFTVKDASGNTVTTFTQDSVSAGVNNVEWDGTDSTGNRVEEGYYSVEATAVSSAGNDLKVRLSLEGTVEAVVYRDGSAYLRVNGTEIALGDVSTIAAAGSLDNESGNDDA